MRAAAPEQRRPADIDHLDGLVDAHEARADLGREGLDVDDDEVDEADALRFQLGELLRHVAPGEDPRVDRGVERLDLATDEGWHLGEIGDAADLDVLGGKELARAIRRDHVDAERTKIAGERSDALAVRH